MFIETLMTKFLRHINHSYLTFADFKPERLPQGRPQKEYLLYVHIPFCEELCPYCSFNRFKFNADLARRYFVALRREIILYGKRNFNCTGVYVGGGTPTVLPEELAETLNLIQGLFPVREISVETNPNHLTDEIVGVLSKAGVNRLSVGVQSFDDNLLKAMERYHKYGGGAEIEARIKQYLGVFSTLNVDMIFNFPSQVMASLQRDLEIIKNIPADQVTFYPLMVSTATEKVISRTLGQVDYRREKLYYEEIFRSLENDYRPGSAWCFSRKEAMIDEYIVDYDEYLGVGSGSFSYVNGVITANTFSVGNYCEKLEKDRTAVAFAKEFTLLERMRYDFMIKLFGTRLDLAGIRRRYGSLFQEQLWKELALFKALGALRVDGDHLFLTRKGYYYWVIMMREFFIGVNNFRDICREGVKEEG
ncbi:MAG TPA: coproporphyrinogen III oxidase family protein [Proteobacteria bacterium]|nr:coproporphyrinogen III oxidase family protein [Pseudomonadota bacterium]